MKMYYPAEPILSPTVFTHKLSVFSRVSPKLNFHDKCIYAPQPRNQKPWTRLATLT